MMLGREDLLRCGKKKQIRFEPDISPNQIGLSSVDLRLGWLVTTQKAQQAVIIRPAHDFDPTDHTQTTDYRDGREKIIRLKTKGVQASTDTRKDICSRQSCCAGSREE